MTGTITSTHAKRGYGFIVANLQDFMFRFGDAPAIVLIEPGRQVQFDPAPARIAGRAPRAVNVRPL